MFGAPWLNGSGTATTWPVSTKGQGMGVTATRALIVDDDPDMRQLVRVVLEVEAGFHCDEAGDAFHALEAWHAQHHDVLVVDQRMPGITGLELAQAILEADPEQIVILVSAYFDNHPVD